LICLMIHVDWVALSAGWFSMMYRDWQLGSAATTAEIPRCVSMDAALQFPLSKEVTVLDGFNAHFKIITTSVKGKGARPVEKRQ